MSTIEHPESTPRRLVIQARGIFKKQVILLVRYPLNLISGLLTIYIFFALMFFGGTAIAGEPLGDHLEGLIIGFFLWTMALSAFSDLTWNITREAQWGTLEQLYMTTSRFEVLMLLKSVVNVVVSFFMGFIILAMMLLTTREMLVIDVFTIIPVTLFGLLSVIGLGFIFGGLAVIYKRIENMFQILTFGLIGLVAAPVGMYPFLQFLPLSQSSHLLQLAMSDGVRLWEIAPADILVLVGVAGGYLAIGIAFFTLAQRRARRLGVMGHY